VWQIDYVLISPCLSTSVLLRRMISNLTIPLALLQ
jgi:hypothetical protein